MNSYLNYEWYRNNEPITSSYANSLFSPNEAYIKGNLFRNLYNQYKNYQPAQLNPKNEREKKLIELSAIAFATHELNLYLDIHPEDQSMLSLFNDYRNRQNELREEYEREYGPLKVCSNSLEGKSIFTWESEAWPWEVKNV